MISKTKYGLAVLPLCLNMIAGGALVVGGISMGAIASQTSDNLDTCRSNPACNRTDRELGIANDVRSQALVADILWATGSAVVVTGAVLYFFLDESKPADSVSGFHILPLHGGAAAAAGFRF